jgi:DNA mismatch repair protein MutS2
LAQAIVNYLRDLGATTFVATHYPELKIYASQTPGATNASLLFDVETLMPTYEMSIGMPGRSNAFAIGRRLGLSDEILDEAMILVGTGSNKTETLLDSIYEIRERISSQEAGTRLALEQAKKKRNSLSERLEKIEVERKQILEESRQKGEAELKNLRQEIHQVRRQLRDTESLNKLKKLQKQSKQAEDQLEIRLKPESEPLKQLKTTKRRRRNQSDLQVGDTVFVTTLGAKGRIVALDRKAAEVAVGRLHMRAQFDELEFRQPEIVEETLPDAVRSTRESPGMELDIRGRRVEEGVADVEQYLDAAFLARLPWVRIIHGKGSGRLRDAVRDALKSNAHASSWEDGKENEGGSGVTVVKLISD